jgi:hypothetical protein
MYLIKAMLINILHSNKVLTWKAFFIFMSLGDNSDLQEASPWVTAGLAGNLQDDTEVGGCREQINSHGGLEGDPDCTSNAGRSESFPQGSSKPSFLEFQSYHPHGWLLCESGCHPVYGKTRSHRSSADGIIILEMCVWWGVGLLREPASVKTTRHRQNGIVLVRHGRNSVLHSQTQVAGHFISSSEEFGAENVMSFRIASNCSRPSLLAPWPTLILEWTKKVTMSRHWKNICDTFSLQAGNGEEQDCRLGREGNETLKVIN